MSLAWNSSDNAAVSASTTIDQSFGFTDWAQTALNVAGNIPEIGAVANGANALISLARGNNTQAAMYAGAAALSVFVPGGQAIAESGELAVDAAQFVKTSEGLASAAEAAEASGSTALDIIRYPPNRGFAWGPDTITLPEGSLIDRYGYESGTFASPVGTPAEMRALAPGTVANKPYGVYRVTQAIDGVQAGPAMPWFNQPGFGMQYELPTNIQDLIRSGFLERIEQ